MAERGDGDVARSESTHLARRPPSRRGTPLRPHVERDHDTDSDGNRSDRGHGRPPPPPGGRGLLSPLAVEDPGLESGRGWRLGGEIEEGVAYLSHVLHEGAAGRTSIQVGESVGPFDAAQDAQAQLGGDLFDVGAGVSPAAVRVGHGRISDPTSADRSLPVAARILVLAVPSGIPSASLICCAVWP